jgi:hypothetical protein
VKANLLASEILDKAHQTKTLLAKGMNSKVKSVKRDTNSKTPKSKEKPSDKSIVIDKAIGLVFANEELMFEHFEPQVLKLESAHKIFLKDTAGQELDETNWPKSLEYSIEDSLDQTLDEPQEIWHDLKSLPGQGVYHFVRPLEEIQAYHVATAYVSEDDEPTFIFHHFISGTHDLIDCYRRGDLVYDRAIEEVGFGSIEGDSLLDGDPLAIGLFISMLKVRSEKDVAEESFQDLGAQCREETIEAADEIWRHSDSAGNVIVNFIKEFEDHEIEDLHYIAVTVEDPASKVHSLLFSFPTLDLTLVDRYRQGENLQADEVSQESSH